MKDAVTADRKIPVRKVIKMPQDKEGLFIQPHETGPDFERDEQHRRDNAAHIASYADNITGNVRTFDVEGRYNCGRCNKQDGNDGCLIKPGSVDLDAGSCRYWEIRCAGDAELSLGLGALIAADIKYGVPKNRGAARPPGAGRAVGPGFGCFRCGKYVEPAQAPDSQGRTLFCRKFSFRTHWNACCAYNAAPTVTAPADDDEPGNDEEMKTPGAAATPAPVRSAPPRSPAPNLSAKTADQTPPQITAGTPQPPDNTFLNALKGSLPQNQIAGRSMPPALPPLTRE